MIVHSDHPKSTAMAFGLGVEVAAYGCALHAIFFSYVTDLYVYFQRLLEYLAGA